MRIVGQGILDAIDPSFREARTPIVGVKFVHANKFTAEGYYKALISFASYLRGLGKGGPGERPEVFGFPDETVDIADLVEQAWHSPHNFQLVLSPRAEIFTQLPMKEFAQSWMLQIQQDLGVRLSWMGVIHVDEIDHPHVQILLVGRSRTRQPFRLAGEYWRHTMRARAAELVEKFGVYA